MKTIDELLAEGVEGKRVFVRADLNVPLADGQITDDGRIRAVLPTVKALADAGAKVIVASHLGRPKGAPDPAFSLLPAAERLAELLGKPVAFAQDTVGPAAHDAVDGLEPGQVAVIENLRFNAGETSKDDTERGEFADRLAALADVYVGDGFGAVHRKHASVYDLPARLPHYAGYLIATEVGVLKKLTDEVKRPYVVALGGAKVSDKLAVIDQLLGKADRLLIGGGMAYTFLKAQGHEVGISSSRRTRSRPSRSTSSAPRTTASSWCSPWTSWSRRTSPTSRPRPRPTPPPSPRTPSRPTRRVSTSVRRPASCTHRSSPTPGRCSGTARWASSSTPTTPRAPRPSPRRSSTPRPSRSSAVATRRGRPAPRLRRECIRPHLDRRRRLLEYLEGKTLPGLAALED